MASSPAPRMALATSAEHPQGVEETPLAERLDATWAVWDDPAVDWPSFDLVVVRSTWDYHARRDAFLAWAAGVPRLSNPADVLAWNTDKRYLGELAAAGLPTVPTRFVAPGEALPADLPTLRGEHVVKPTVSAGARDTGRFLPGQEAERDALVARIHAAGHTAMVQPFVASVDERGESALLHFDGRLSHAIEKGRILERGAAPSADEAAMPEIRPLTPSPDEEDVARRALELVRERFGLTPLYARVDLVRGDDGAPLLLELELVEPFLFLGASEGASERFADAIRARAATVAG